GARGRLLGRHLAEPVPRARARGRGRPAGAQGARPQPQQVRLELSRLLARDDLDPVLRQDPAPRGPSGVVARTTYTGRSMERKCTRARYSPMMPRAKSCAPEKIAMIDARKGKPGTLPPAAMKRPMT